jgi:serine/threonine-protein kinase
MSVDGRVTLEQRLKSGPMPVDEAVRVVWGLCDRFEKTARGETLGDVTPARVTLYGRTVEVDIPDAAPLPHSSAPERRQGPPTPRSDVYAMGALLAHLLLGRPPDGAPLPAPAAHLQPVVDRCLAVDPQARYASLSELKRALVRLDKTLASGPRPSGSQPIVRTSLGPWTIEALLGQGSMGQVFKARHQSLGRLAAIKVLRPEQYQQPELIGRFFQEARTVNQINHEHIVEISDFVQEPGEAGPSAVYCVMEFLQGRTLGDLLEDQPVGIVRGLRIVEQVCDALAAAHRVGVVHRDVKPDNIMLIERGGSKDYVKVLDFGVAKLTDTDGKAMVATTEGAIIGTPICMSPEQAQGDSVDGRSDIWAIGVILYKLLTGVFPFDAPTFVNIAVQIITKPYAPLPAKNKLGEPIPPRLRALVERCLQKPRELRPASMAEVRDELRAIVSGDAAPRPSRWPLVTAAVVALAGLAGVGLWWSQQAPAREATARPPPPAIAPLVEADAGREPLAVVAPTEVADAGDETAPDARTAMAEPLDAGLEEAPSRRDAGVSAKRVTRPVELTEAMVRDFKRQRDAAIRGCVELARANLPREGTVVAKIQLRATGEVKVLQVLPTNSPLQQCVTRALKGSRFPPLVGGPYDIELRFPFVVR